MSSFSHLFSPLTLKSRTLKNRVVSSSHAPGYISGGLPNERYMAYHEEKARGGLAMTMFGGSSNISRESGSIYGQINLGDDAIIDAFRTFSARIHAHDCLLMCQMTHMGRRTGWAAGDWLPTMGPSVVRDPAHHSVPYEMSGRDINRVIKDFGKAAKRCYEGGLDGVEILATTHLLGQFLSPLSNFREDDYGGTLENRARFLLQVLEEVCASSHDDFLISVRYAADESNEEGMTSEEGIALGAILGKQGIADFLNINGAYGGTDHGLAETFPGMAYKSAPYVALAGKVRAASGLPVMQAARLSDPATADWAIEAGHVDMAGMTRPHMADPHIVNKLLNGQEDQIRPCVGAGYCIDRIYGGKDTLCVHNVSTGREEKFPHTIPIADQEKKIVIVGGGPAGMEAARVAALRGHEVSLYEAGKELGGQILLASKASWRKDMIGIARWLEGEIVRLGVTIHTNAYMEGEDLRGLDADMIVVATGGLPDTALQDTADEHVQSLWDILAGDVSAASSILVYDEEGGHAGMSVAMKLAEEGKTVSFVSPDRQIGRDVGGMNFPVYLKALYKAGVEITTDTRLTGVKKQGNLLEAALRNNYSRETVMKAVEQVIVNKQTLPMDMIFQDLIETSSNLGQVDIDALLEGEAQTLCDNPHGRFTLFRIGDAVASRDIHASLLDANRLMRAN